MQQKHRLLVKMVDSISSLTIKEHKYQKNHSASTTKQCPLNLNY